MKKLLPIISAVIISVLILSSVTVCAADKFAGYEAIYTKTQLNNIRYDLNGKYYLANDIVFDDADYDEGNAFYNDGKGFIPIGEYSSRPFTGVFDGNGHKIHNLYVNHSGNAGENYAYGGMFAHLKGTVRNTVFDWCEVDSFIKDSEYYYACNGIVAGYCDGVIENCTVNGGYMTSECCGEWSYGGGLAGEGKNCVIKNCESSLRMTVKVNSAGASSRKDRNGYGGGIIAKADYSQITDCKSSAEINIKNPTQYAYCGGIIGAMSYGYTANCESNAKLTATVSNTAHCGGITGENFYGSVTDCVNKGTVTGSANIENYVGGISGYATYQLRNNKNLGAVTGKSPGGKVYAGGIAGSTRCVVSRCTNSGTVRIDNNGGSYAGGISGRASEKNVEKCSNHGTVISSDCAGGIAGYSETVITDCYNAGTLTATYTVGGITGDGAEKCEISRCYNAGTVQLSTGKGNCGGIAGNGIYFRENNCFYLDSNKTGVGNGTDYCAKLTADKLKKQASLVNFDFNTVWKYETSDGYAYPKIRDVSEIKTVSSVSKFIDVKNTWYTTYTDYALTFGILNGDDKNRLKPNDYMSRAQFVQVLANISGVNTKNTNIETSFVDVERGKWYAPAIEWACMNSIVNGVSDGRFNPNGFITREQMCTMLVRYSNFASIPLNAKTPKKTFSDDAKISGYAKDNVYICQQAGLVEGVSATEFAPKKLATRAQVATIMTRFHKDNIV